MINKKLIVAITWLLIAFSASGQFSTRDNRTPETKIADLLAQLPAAEPSHLNTLMTSMADLGEEGLVKLAGMLNPAGQGDDTPARYAIGGFSKFVSGPAQQYRLLCQQAWCRALDLAEDTEVKAFLITQLQQAGDDHSVPCLEKYLSNEELSDPAARALAAIHTPLAGNALLNALDATQGTALLSLVEALGNMSFLPALEKITALSESRETNLKRLAYFAIASIGSPSSADVLHDAARLSGFTYEPTRATASYLMWISRLNPENKSVAIKHCTGLIKQCRDAEQVHTRSAALTQLVQLSGAEATPYLHKAMKSSNREYWMTALSLAHQLKGGKQTLEWINLAGKTSGQQKADLVIMLGERGDTAATNRVRQALNDPEESVRLAGILSLPRLLGESALPDLLAALKKGSPNEVAAIQLQLLSLQSNAMLAEVAAAIPTMPAGARIALIEIVASRRNPAYLDLIYAQAESEDAGVRLAALKALSGLVSSKDLQKLYDLLSKAVSAEEETAVQSAIVAAAKGLPGEIQDDEIIGNMKKARASERKIHYPILAGIANDATLKAMAYEFKTAETREMKDAAFKALIQWPSPDAINVLYPMGIDSDDESRREQTFHACLKLIDRSEYTDDKRLLLLRKVMDLASNDGEKSQVIELVGECPTYLALKYAEGFLDNPALQQKAASAAGSIALSNKSIYGKDVRTALERIMGILNGPESDYQREAIRKHLADMSDGEGFVSLFNGRDLTGWKGLVEDPLKRMAMKPAELVKAQARADEIMRSGWKVENGILVFTGNGENLCTTREYGDFEMIVDWKITEKGDAGIYLRGSPQVQIWDTSRRDAGAQVGSGGLYNNQVYERNPLQVADNQVGEWNTFRILMQGERVTVYLNGLLVVDNTIMENYWDRNIPIFPAEQIELQAHGTWVGYRDIYVREIQGPEPYKVSEQEKAEGYTELFDGISMFQWTGNTKDYVVEDGCIAVYPKHGGKGNLYTKAEYSDFSLRFEFRLTPGANNGIGIRTPMEGDAAYVGMEIQVLDNTAPIYRNLKEYQYHGSVYGVIPARREFLKPVGEWNEEEIYIKGNHIRVTLNGTVIVDGDIEEASRNGTLDHNEHPGLKNEKGHIGFLGHGSELKFRNIRIRDLKETE